MTGQGMQLPHVFRDPASASAELDALLIDLTSRRRADLARPIAVGLCGPQGSGKSTMAARLARDLTQAGCPAAVLSLDDFYLGQSERTALARDIHPLLATRGVPGTHDVGLAMEILTSLLDLHAGGPTIVPVFDKARDDRAPESEWRRVDGPINVVIIEGWCLGARAQSACDLVHPVNGLEREEDPEGRWRHYVNDQLSNEYSKLFERLSLCVLLRAPSFETIQNWRAEQEAGLRRSCTGSLPPMDADALHRFIAHYERLTRWMYRDAPADIVVDLDSKRIPIACCGGSTGADSDGPLSRRLATTKNMSKWDESADMRLASYGTLAPRRSNHHHLSVLRGQWSKGTVRGMLVDAGWGAALGFPGLILDSGGALIDVHLFQSAELPDHWPRLDAFEGPEYSRVIATVCTAEGDKTACIYVLAKENLVLATR